MDYRIDFDRSLEEEVRRIAGELLTDAVERLADRKGNRHTAIHDARKNIKRVRALYRLIASEAGEFQLSENARLRDIAGALSHLRDSAALAETTDYLEGITEDGAEKAAIDRLGKVMKERRDKLAGARKEIGQTLTSATAELRKASAAAKAFAMPKGSSQSIDCIAVGWKKTGKRALKALADCKEDGEEEAFHGLRKRGQDRFMQAALLGQIWPTGLTAIQRQAKALVDILGREHDLAVLASQLRDDKQAEDRRQVLQSIAAERQKLQAAAREAAVLVFDEKPKRDAKTIALLIRNRG